MKKKTTGQFRTGIRNILHAAHVRLQNLYDEFADILDTDEDRLSLQYNTGAMMKNQRSSRSNRSNRRTN